ncbi:MAG: 5'-nucleotidase [Gammaproteobacteria bacterium]
MSINLQGKLVIAISSRALFNLDESHAVYEQDGIEAYLQYQIDNENNILASGVAYTLVKKLLALSDPQTHESITEVILLSRNSADTGLRVFNSIQHHQLPITRAVFTNGEPPYQYIRAFGGHLFLSANNQDVVQALAAGCAAATILKSDNTHEHVDQLRIAFDGDAVIFSDEAERVYQEDGIAAFRARESAAAQIPLLGGPFKNFLSELHQLQKRFPANTCPVRTALITARDAPAHERVIRTLRAWNIRIDEALFLGGLAKGDFLKAFGADIFFDDQRGHCESASQHVATGHVPHGIANS